jgi:phosphonate transport system ATP-binding protein
VPYAIEFADRIVGISAGQVVFEGAPAQLDNEALARIYPGLEMEDEPDSPERPAPALRHVPVELSA